MAALFMAVMMISRTAGYNLVASYAGCIAGLSFVSVVAAPQLARAVSRIDYLAWFFYESIATGLLHVHILGLGFAARRLGKPEGSGEPCDNVTTAGTDSTASSQTESSGASRGQYEIVRVQSD